MPPPRGGDFRADPSPTLYFAACIAPGMWLQCAGAVMRVRPPWLEWLAATRWAWKAPSSEPAWNLSDLKPMNAGFCCSANALDGER